MFRKIFSILASFTILLLNAVKVSDQPQGINYLKNERKEIFVSNKNTINSVDRVAVIGAGYVGLVTGTCLAEKGFAVTMVENNPAKIDSLLKGEVPFYEPGLDKLLETNIQNKKLSFTSSIAQAMLSNPQVIFSCVGTPPLPDGSADLSYVWNVAIEIGKNLNKYCLVINKSTVPVGTGQQVKKIIETQLKDRGTSIPFDVASNPEFLKEGDALNDFLNPDRIVVGVESKKAEELLFQIYTPFIAKNDQFLVMNIPSAELTKYASNAMLATRISFMNELANLAEKVGADINQVKLGMSKDRRIGPYFLNAGIGYGGSCFPKDVKALIATGLEYNQPMELVQSVENVNNNQRVAFARKILNYYGSSISQKHLGIWGITFKPETDDLRCAPSIDIVKILLKNGAKITVYDPVGMPNFKTIFENRINYAQTAQEILKKCDALILLTEWKEFLKYSPSDFSNLKDAVVFDGRNCFDPTEMFYSGVKYFCIGRTVTANLETIKQRAEFFASEILQK
jgi:UDPglucose 6-dehydrogenase